MILVLLPWSEGTNLSHWSVKKKKKQKKPADSCICSYIKSTTTGTKDPRLQ